MSEAGAPAETYQTALERGRRALVFGWRLRGALLAHLRGLAGEGGTMDDERREACPLRGCQEVLRHEHRLRQFHITTGMFWGELYEDDIRLLNEARATHDLPMILWRQTKAGSSAQELMWTPEGGIQSVEETDAEESERGDEGVRGTGRADGVDI